MVKLLAADFSNRPLRSTIVELEMLLFRSSGEEKAERAVVAGRGQ
jgi:hypothetical protein